MTFYRWRREYGRLRVDQARRLKELEKISTFVKSPPNNTPETQKVSRAGWDETNRKRCGNR